MTIDEAIKQVENAPASIYSTYYPDFPEAVRLAEAVQLGIEALKRVQECRLADHTIKEPVIRRDSVVNSKQEQVCNDFLEKGKFIKGVWFWHRNEWWWTVAINEVIRRKGVTIKMGTDEWLARLAMLEVAQNERKRLRLPRGSSVTVPAAQGNDFRSLNLIKRLWLLLTTGDIHSIGDTATISPKEVNQALREWDTVWKRLRIMATHPVRVSIIPVAEIILKADTEKESQ